jgi:cation diffusion facilitator family transporter
MTDDGGTLRAVIAAFLGNLAIGITKGIAAVLTGSGALLAETAHSFADAMNQLLLFIGVRRSVRAPTPLHPLGHGKERYFWALVVALLLFFGGGVFSLLEAWNRFQHPHEITQANVGFIVLGLSVVFECFSLGAALREVRHAARADGVTVGRFLRELRDPALRTVLFEDSAALLGLLVALAALGLTVVTGDHRWDAVGSAAIGVLLVVVALVLAADARVLIIGEAPPEAERRALRELLAAQPDVEAVTELLAVRMGARQLLVMARLSVRDDLRGDEIERLVLSLRHKLKERPQVMEAFLEVSPLPKSERPAG